MQLWTPNQPSAVSRSQSAIAEQNTLLREARQCLHRDDFERARSLIDRALRIDTGIPPLRSAA